MGVIITFCVIGMLIAMAVQALTNSPPITLSLYFKFTVFNVILNYLFLAALAMAVQTFVPNRIIGMITAAGAIILVTLFIQRLPFYHPLIGFGATTPGPVSEISPYNNWIQFRWFNFYWGLFVLALAIFSMWVWRRGLQTGLFTRFKSIGENISLKSSAVLFLTLTAFIGTGIFIHHAYDKVSCRGRTHVPSVSMPRFTH